MRLGKHIALTNLNSQCGETRDATIHRLQDGRIVLVFLTASIKQAQMQLSYEIYTYLNLNVYNDKMRLKLQWINVYGLQVKYCNETFYVVERNYKF